MVSRDRCGPYAPAVREGATRAQQVADRFHLVRKLFYLDVASGPFYGFNRPGAKVLQGVIQNWWRQGMMGGALAHYEGIKAFSETDQTDDLKAIAVPTLIVQGEDDQVVPYKDAAVLQHELIRNSEIKLYPGYPHGAFLTHADVINPDLLAFIKS